MKARFLFLAVAAMGLTVACNNSNTAAEDTVDSTPVEDTTMVAELVDSVAIDSVAEETPAPAAQKTAATKKTTTDPNALKTDNSSVMNDGKANTNTGKRDRQSDNLQNAPAQQDNGIVAGKRKRQGQN
jgi:hypothetical protein